MSSSLIDKVYIGLDNAPAAFDIKSRIIGPNGTNLEYIRSETGVVAVLKVDKLEPLHLTLHHTRTEALAAARSLALNLIETIRAELAQWSAAQAGGPPPALNVPPPTLTTSSAPPPAPPPAGTAVSSPPTMTSSAQPTMMPPVVSVAPAATPLMTVRQPLQQTVLQLLPQQSHQQQYVLNQENGQLIPIVQPGMQVSNANFNLPIAHQALGLQQHNFGAQMIDLSSMQPVNVTQLRLSGVPSSTMILPNGLAIPQASMASSDTTTVSSATSAPVVCAAPSINSSQKILYSTDKDKEVKYHIQGPDGVQWSMPGSQTMLIPYQQLQEFAAGQQAMPNLQQQYVSIAPSGGLQQACLPFSAAQLQQLQAAGTIMQLNQKPIASSGSLINIISTGQASSPQINSSTPSKTAGTQESRGQKRLSDGSPSQLQLRPIAPAGSISQDKSTSRDARSWTSAGAGRENTVVSMGMKINPTHGTIIHVSSGQQTNVSGSGMSQDGSGMYIRQIDRSMQLQKDKDAGKAHNQNVQMITVPPGMTVLQNPLNIGPVPTVLGQAGNQVYMIPANQNLVQGGLPQSLIGQQMLPGQNVTVMQPNQLGVPGVQYNVPLMQMNMQNQYVPGLNLNSQLSAQQLNAALAGQLQLPNQQIGAIPIVQQPPNQTQQPVQLLPQSFMTPTTYGAVPQYMMPANSGPITAQNSAQYSLPAPPASTGNGNGNGNSSEGETGNGTGQNYITSSQEPYAPTSAPQTFPDGANTAIVRPNPSVTPNYGGNGGTPTPTNIPYNPPPTSYPTNGSTQSNYPPTSQSTPQTFSPSTTPAPNYPAPGPAMPVAYPPNQNPYPNATGQNLAAYASNQYQYNSRPWFRPRYVSPQGSPYSSGAGPPTNPPPMPVPPPSGNYNYWQDS